MSYIFLIFVYAFIMNILFYVFIPTHIEEYPEDMDEYTDEEEDTQNLLKNNEEKWNII